MLKAESGASSIEDVTSELRFEHYREMLSGKLPFQGSGAELMYQQQHAALPMAKLKNVPAPIVMLLEVLLAKDPGQRFQSPAQLRKAVSKVREAIGTGSCLTTEQLRSIGDREADTSSKRKPRNQTVRRVLVCGLCLVGLLLGWCFVSDYRGPFFSHRSVEATPAEKSIAVLPFENISANKDDAYFADGVQDEILNNLAKVAQLKVISRTSVMQYRADANAICVRLPILWVYLTSCNEPSVGTEIMGGLALSWSMLAMTTRFGRRVMTATSLIFLQPKAKGLKPSPTS